jgi:hypothetical protein
MDTKRITAPVLVVAVAFGLAACGGGGTVAVTLQEFSVLPESDTASAGEVTFEATNEGPNDPHELVVIRTDLAPDALPTTEEGGVDEEGEGIEVIGEIEEFPVGETESATFDLEAGSYVLICNIVEEEDGELESHYVEGMRTAFAVE